MIGVKLFRHILGHMTSFILQDSSLRKATGEIRMSCWYLYTLIFGLNIFLVFANISLFAFGPCCFVLVPAKFVDMEIGVCNV